MILQALTAYYEQLVRQGKLSAPGWDDSFKVSYELRLNDAGRLVSVLDLRTETKMGKKTVLAPRAMRVPAHVKRTAGVSANLLCDNSSYLLGADEKVSRSVQSSASMPVRRCTTGCWTMLTAPPPGRSLLILTAGIRRRLLRIPYWLSSGRRSPATPT